MKSIKLTALADRELSDLQMAHLEGGSASASTCGCACAYKNNGGSSTHDNGVANHESGIPADPIYGGTLPEVECVADGPEQP